MYICTSIDYQHQPLWKPLKTV